MRSMGEKTGHERGGRNSKTLVKGSQRLRAGSTLRHLPVWVGAGLQRETRGHLQGKRQTGR